MFITTVDYEKTTNFGTHVETTEAWEGSTEKQSVDLAMKKALEIMKPEQILTVTTKEV
jgi:hypothetical protein|tara:strand:+ start:222 stop:395 length:174 start_codon:yes stop_codon:yes gene_type:complete